MKIRVVVGDVEIECDLTADTQEEFEEDLDMILEKAAAQFEKTFMVEVSSHVDREALN